MKDNFKDAAKRLTVIFIASFIMALNTRSFVRTGGLYPGGATGLTLLIQRAAFMFLDIELPFSAVNLILNAFPLYIGFRYIGKKFTSYSCVMIVLTGLLTDFLPGYVITYDTLLISIFGGIINGFAISLCLMINSTTGGTDFIAIYLSEKKGMDSWNMVLGINMAILSIAGILFGWDKALYSIIFQFCTTRVLHVLYTRYQHQTLFIVTNFPEDVCRSISAVSHHGATILDAEGSYTHSRRALVYSVIAVSQKRKVIKAIREADPSAFINAMRTEQIQGTFYREPTE